MKKLIGKIALLVLIFFCSVITVVRPSFFARSSGPAASRFSFKYVPKMQNQFPFYFKTYWANFRSWLSRPKRLDQEKINVDPMDLTKKQNDNREEGNNT